MPHPFAGNRLVIASHNPGKVEEIAALLAPFAVETIAAGSLGISELDPPAPPQPGQTIV